MGSWRTGCVCHRMRVMYWHVTSDFDVDYQKQGLRTNKGLKVTARDSTYEECGDNYLPTRVL